MRYSTVCLTLAALCLTSVQAAEEKRQAASGLAPYEQRLRTAKSVKVIDQILGLGLGATVEEAHQKLDTRSKDGKPTREEVEKEEGGRERKILWELVETDYSAVLIRTDDEGRIRNITAFFREGKEMPFEKIGEVKKAPVHSPNAIAWDVIRPKRPLFRVAAQGADEKARSITILEVKRSGATREGRESSEKEAEKRK